MFAKLGLIAIFVAGVTEVLASPLATTSVVTTTTTEASATPTLACKAPAPPSNRPKCQSPGASGAFALQLGTCHNRLDGLYLDPVFNSTTDSAFVFTNSSGPQFEYLYPIGYGAYGPAAWRGLFGGAGSDSTAPTGLSPVIFADNNGDFNTYSCAITQDLAPLQCGYNGYGVKFWYVQVETGEFFSALSEVRANGYQQVVPYIIQICN